MLTTGADRSVQVLPPEPVPTRRGPAQRVLRLVDHPDTGARSLAHVIGADPGLTAKVLRVANSAYYGLPGRVSSLPFAVSVVGFQTVRSLAVVAAAGLDDPRCVPDGFWLQAARSAAAAELVAPLLAVPAPDAFCLGLLHDIGTALLHQEQSFPRPLLPEPEEMTPALQAEHARYGQTHEQAGARLLAQWRFPSLWCEVIARHHAHLVPGASPLERVLYAGRTLASRLDPPKDATGADPATSPARLGWLTEGRLPLDRASGLVARLAPRVDALLAALQAE